MAFRHYEHLTFEEPTSPYIAPDFVRQTVDCPRCGLQHSVENDRTDWRAVAAQYKKAYDTMAKSFQNCFAEAEEVWDVPLVGWLQGKREVMLTQLREVMTENPDPNYGE